MKLLFKINSNLKQFIKSVKQWYFLIKNIQHSEPSSVDDDDFVIVEFCNDTSFEDFNDCFDSIIKKHNDDIGSVDSIVDFVEEKNEKNKLRS